MRCLFATFVLGLLFVGTGCGGVSTRHVTKAQLALMVLPRSALGSLPCAFVEDRLGFETNAQRAAESLDPRVTRVTLARGGRLSGYSLAFTREQAGMAAGFSRRTGLRGVVTDVELFRSASAAAAQMSRSDADLRVLVGKPLKNGATLEQAASFALRRIGDAASGWRYEVGLGGEHGYFTKVAFRYGRLLAGASELRADPTNVDAAVISLATTLATRIKSVLRGKIHGASGVAAASSGAGRLDRSFGDRGLVATSFKGQFGDEADAVVVQRDGKIVAVGRGDGRASYAFVLARYETNGRLDASFGNAGLVRTTFGSRGDSDAYAAALQSDGKIVAGGDHKAGRYFEFALARYNPSGSLDRSFGTSGKVVTSFGSGGGGAVSAIAVQPDGKIIVVGSQRIGRYSEFALARYDANGRLDPSFGRAGKVLTAIGTRSDDEARAVAIQRDGRIAVAGSHQRGNRFTYALARYTPNGRLDPGSGGRGAMTTTVGSMSAASALAIQYDGDLVVGGGTWAPSVGFALARYRPNGSLDPNFGSCGTVTTAFGGGGLPSVSGLAIEPDGKLVAAGSDPLNIYGFLLARYNSDGSPDASFGKDGKATTTFPTSSEDDLNAMVLQPDGKIVAVGATDPNDNGYEFALARFHG